MYEKCVNLINIIRTVQYFIIAAQIKCRQLGINKRNNRSNIKLFVKKKKTSTANIVIDE